MKISVITACYESVAFIRTAMESVLAQTWPETEYLVIDGGSTDGTVEIIREFESKFGGRMRWVSEPSSGFYDALNKGIRMATGDVIGILNADDFYDKAWVLERVAKAFEGDMQTCGDEAARSSPSETRPDAVYADVRFVKSESLGQTVRHYSAKRWQPWMLRWGYMPPHPTFFCRKACFERLGYYKLDYKIAADYELLIRFLWKGGLRAHYIPEVIITMRLGGISTKGVRSTITLNREIVRGNRENGVYTNLLMLCPKYAFKVFEFVLPCRVKEDRGSADSLASRTQKVEKR